MREIWKSNDTEDLLNLSFDEKIDELISMGYDAGTLENMSEDEIDRIISDDPSVVNEPLEDFEYNIVPKIAAQVKDGLIFDERFNLVDPSKLLDFNGYSATLDEDDNGELLFNVEGRKAFPILGFSPDQEDFINQLERLGILDTLHNLYPEKEDEDFDDPYYYADLIPMDWSLLEEVCTKPSMQNYEGVKEDMNEANTKNPKGLAKEYKEIKELSDEYGREYFTQMPFTSYDNDPMSIEMQYPEFFRIVKSFFKEMGILEGDQLNDTDILDMSWDEDISQHDWDTLMAVCDRLVSKGGTVQIEKIYKNNFNDHLGSDDEILADREKQEAEFEESLDEGLSTAAKDALENSFTRVTDDNYSDEDLEDLYDQACKMADDEEELLNNHDAAIEYLKKLVADSKELLDEEKVNESWLDNFYNEFNPSGDEYSGFVAYDRSILDNMTDWLDEHGIEYEVNYADHDDHYGAYAYININEDQIEDESLDESMIKAGDELFMTSSYGGMEGRDIIERYFSSEEAAKQNAINDTWNDGFKLYRVVFNDAGNGLLKKEEELIGDIECGRDLKRKANKKESLDEGAAEEIAMHQLKEKIASFIYDEIADVDDNIALSVHAAIPEYNIEWCPEEPTFNSDVVETKKKALARAIADVLFENAPRELGESLTEGFKGLAREINKEFRKDMKEWDNAKVYADEDGLDLAEVSADSDLIKKIEKFVKAKGYKVKYTSDDGFLAINESLNEEIWHNRGAGDCEIIERSASGRNALVKRLADGALQPYVIALGMGEDSWGQGKYYTELEDAKRDWKRYKYE